MRSITFIGSISTITFISNVTFVGNSSADTPLALQLPFQQSVGFCHPPPVLF